MDQEAASVVEARVVSAYIILYDYSVGLCYQALDVEEDGEASNVTQALQTQS